MPWLDRREEALAAEMSGHHVARSALRPGGRIAPHDEGSRPPALVEPEGPDAEKARAQQRLAPTLVPRRHDDAVHDARFGVGEHFTLPLAGPVHQE